MDMIFYMCIITCNFVLFVHYYVDAFSAEFMSNTVTFVVGLADNDTLRAETCQNYNIGCSGLLLI
jgi:hypothetical protein